MKVWASILCVLWGGMTAAATRNLSYEELPNLIRQNDPGVKAAESSIDAARLQSGALNRSFLPRLGLESGLRGQKEADGTKDSVPYWKLDAIANIYRGGRDAFKEQASEAQVALRQLDAEALMRKVLMKVRTDYVKLAAMGQLIELNAELTQSVRQKKKTVQKKIGAGILAESFATDFLLFEQGLEQDRLFLEKQMLEIEDRLLLALGLSPQTKLQVKALAAIAVAPEPPAAEVKDLAELKKMDLAAKAARQASARPAEWWRADVDLFASYTSLTMEDQMAPGPLPAEETAIGLRFTFHLDESAEARQQSTRLKSEAAILDLQKADLTREAELEVHEYFHDIRALRPILRTLDQHIKSAEALQKKIDLEFERGVRDSSAVLEALRRLHELKQRRLEALLEYQLAKAGLQTFLSL